MLATFDPPGIRMFVARSIQLGAGFFICVVGAYLNADQLSGGILSSVSAGCAAIVMLVGFVGMFAFYRPRDVHWHLTLTLDSIAVVLCVWCAFAFTYLLPSIIWHPNKSSAALSVAGAVFAYLMLLANAYAIGHVVVLKRRGKLPRPGHSQEDWLHMETNAPAKYANADASESATRAPEGVEELA